MKSVQNLEMRLKKIEEMRTWPGMGVILIVDSREPGHQDRLKEQREYMNENFPDYIRISARQVTYPGRPL